MMSPYSVLMSVYIKENPQYLAAAIDSMLGQTVKPSDFVLVCDGPLTDELNQVIEGFLRNYPSLFQVVRLNQNQGLGIALNVGLEACKYEIVARMDTDDVALPERMSWQISTLENCPDLSAVGGQIQEFYLEEGNERGRRLVPTTPETVRKMAAKRNPMNHMTVTFRKSDVIAAGSYQHFDKFEDYYLWARMLAAGMRLTNVNQICVHVRVNDDMYRRRSGWKYFLQTVQLEKYLKSRGLCTTSQFVQNILTRFCGTVLVPNCVRQYLYRAVLRK